MASYTFVLLSFNLLLNTIDVECSYFLGYCFKT